MGAAAIEDGRSGGSAGREAAGGSHRVPAGASVTVLRGFYEGLEIPVESDWFVIGRGRTADAVLAEPTISRAHAAIGWNEARGFYVEDLGSTNGTLVNGKRRDRQKLKTGDEIQIGKLRFKVLLPRR